MKFEIGDNVYTVDGQNVGSVDRVVLDPRSNQVTHLVVQQGAFFSEDKVIPIELVGEEIQAGLQLHATVDVLHDLPPFEETHYIPLDRDTSADAQAHTERPLYWYPFNAVTPFGLYPAYYPALGRLANVETERNLPSDAVVLSEGASILSQEGEKVGTLERVLTDEKTNQATHLVLSAGWLFPAQKLVPVAWIGTVSNDEIHLAVTAPVLERVPTYEQERSL